MNSEGDLSTKGIRAEFKKLLKIDDNQKTLVFSRDQINCG